MQYFWRILDVYHKGAIDSFIINMFFRAVIQKLEIMDRGGFNVEDIKDEIFDMAKPELPMAITLQDLIKCGQGDIIVAMLIDAKAFYDYDQRENGATLEVFDEFWRWFAPDNLSTLNKSFLSRKNIFMISNHFAAITTRTEI